MFVLGIDPGLSRCGYGIVHQQAAGVRATAVGVLRTAPALPDRPSAWPSCSATSGRCSRSTGPQVVAIERVLFQVNVRTAIPVAQAAGIAMAEAVAAGCEVVEYSPNQVKQAVAGVGGASKDQMERMVQTLLGHRPAPPSRRRRRRRRAGAVPPRPRAHARDAWPQAVAR